MDHFPEYAATWASLRCLLKSGLLFQRLWCRNGFTSWNVVRIAHLAIAYQRSWLLLLKVNRCFKVKDFDAGMDSLPGIYGANCASRDWNMVWIVHLALEKLDKVLWVGWIGCCWMCLWLRGHIVIGSLLLMSTSSTYLLTSKCHQHHPHRISHIINIIAEQQLCHQ